MTFDTSQSILQIVPITNVTTNMSFIRRYTTYMIICMTYHMTCDTSKGIISYKVQVLRSTSCSSNYEQHMNIPAIPSELISCTTRTELYIYKHAVRCISHIPYRSRYAYKSYDLKWQTVDNRDSRPAAAAKTTNRLVTVLSNNFEVKNTDPQLQESAHLIETMKLNQPNTLLEMYRKKDRAVNHPINIHC